MIPIQIQLIPNNAMTINHINAPILIQLIMHLRKDKRYKDR